ncbi:MAG: hypothetical protein R3F04_02220 [Lysobacteraceae bacterium]
MLLPFCRFAMRVLALSLIATVAWAGTLSLDGRLSESDWDQATRLDDFLTVMPLTRETPPYYAPKCACWRVRTVCIWGSGVSSLIRCRAHDIRLPAMCRRVRTDSM